MICLELQADISDQDDLEKDTAALHIWRKLIDEKTGNRSEPAMNRVLSSLYLPSALGAARTLLQWCQELTAFQVKQTPLLCTQIRRP